MARREYYYSPPCEHEGCRERASYVCATRREQQEAMQSVKRRGGWRCVRHTAPDEVLSAENPYRETVLVSYEESYGRFFRREGQEKGGSGFQHGPGFKIYADDFPAGTRLIVTARVVTPVSENLRKPSEYGAVGTQSPGETGSDVVVGFTPGPSWVLATALP